MSQTNDAATNAADFDPDYDVEFDDRRQKLHWFKRPRRMVLLYTLTFVGTEIVGAFWSIELQAVLAAFLTVVCLNHTLLGYRNERTAAAVMASLFASRLFTITLPTTGVSLATRTAMVAAAMIVMFQLVTAVLRFDLRSARSREGFPIKATFLPRWVITAAVALLGLPLGYLAHEILDPAKQVMSHSLAGSSTLPWMIAGLFLSFGALGEELLYRRLVAAMTHHTATSRTPWVSAFLFSATYLGTRNAAFVGLMFVAGAVFAWSCERTGSIVGPVIAHAVASVMVFLILPTL